MASSGQRDYDQLYKLVLVGDSGVGKSSLLRRFTSNAFDTVSISTTGVDFHSKNITVEDGTVIKAQVWDTGGQDRFKAITPTYYRGAVGVIIVYSLVNHETFDSVTQWLKDVRQITGDGVVALLVGNKLDLAKDIRAVPTEEAVDFAQKNQLSFLETSAADATNVNKAFETIINEIHAKMGSAPSAPIVQPAPSSGGLIGHKAKPVDLDKINLIPSTQQPQKKGLMVSHPPPCCN